MAQVSGFGNSLSFVSCSGWTGVSQDRGSSNRYRFPLPPWVSLAPQPGPHQARKEDRWRDSFSSARAGEGLSLPGPGSGKFLGFFFEYFESTIGRIRGYGGPIVYILYVHKINTKSVVFCHGRPGKLIQLHGLNRRKRPLVNSIPRNTTLWPKFSSVHWHSFP